MTTETPILPLRFAHRFTRDDWHDVGRRSRRYPDVPLLTREQVAELLLKRTLERWVLRRLRRLAGQSGLVYSKPSVSWSYNPMRMCTDIYVWSDYAVLPEQQGVTVVPNDD